MTVIDAIILCGGKGSRLASVVHAVPKPLAPVHGRPFLDYLLDYLLDGLTGQPAGSARLGRVILATGHLAEVVTAHYGHAYRGHALLYSHEATPLGTGGAVMQALRRHRLAQPFLLLNGDSFIDADLAGLQALRHTTDAALCMALFRVDDAARFGTVALDGSRVTGFVEKSGVAAPGTINAGIYLVDPLALAPWRASRAALSFETGIIPPLLAAQGVRGLVSGTRFLDIGLPDTYRAAPGFFGA